MKDNTLRDKIHSIVCDIQDQGGYEREGVSQEDQKEATDQLEALLAEEVRKVKIEELELILNGYGWGEGEEAANFIIKDRIAELEKGK